jgi:uncharacterized membrane protein YfcA
MTVLEALLVFVAGVWAGAINTLVGSGSLVTFPVLLAVGYSPLTANISNNLGVVPGSISGAYGFRRELRGQRARVARFAPASLLGGVVGAALLLALPASAFDAVVPAFVALGVVLVMLQPRINRWLAARREPGVNPHGSGPLALLATFATGVYGGYFGAAQGVLLLAVLGIAIDDDLRRVNALKVVLAGLVNFVAAVVFVIVAQDHLVWGAVALIAAGSAIGGQLGAGIGRRLPAPALRAVIVLVGLAGIAKLLLD